ncbi:MAG: Gfo/Idh/MocA family protein [Eubacteriales bacterium]
MYKIVILGVENSHATHFLSMLADGRYPDIEAVGVYSEEADASERLHDKFGVKIMKSYDEAVGAVDGVMITARHGKHHYEYAKPYLSSGIPMFIDKPITCDGEEAYAFMREAKEHHVRLCGGSVCASLPETKELASYVRDASEGEIVGGNLCCPIQMKSVYGGFYFYAQHLVQIMTTVFGGDVESVCAGGNGDQMSFLARYASYDVSGTFAGLSRSYYHVSVFGKNESQSRLLGFSNSCFTLEMDDMQALLRGEAMKTSYDEFIRPVFIMNAMMRSAASGAWEKVETKLLGF